MSTLHNGTLVSVLEFREMVGAELSSCAGGLKLQ